MLLSEAYRDNAERAAEFGSAVVDRLGGHLDILQHAGVVASALVEVATALRL